jgi:predicted MFS family arabinose efflux permease
MTHPDRADRPKSARLATVAVFLAMGTGIGAWAACIPGIKHGLGLTDATLGIALLSMAGGAILAMPLAGWLGHRYNTHHVSVIAGLAFCAALVMPGLAPSLPTLMAATTLLGLCAGCMDVTMNAQATQIERAWGSAINSSFHAAYSLGGLLGAGSTGLLLACGLGQSSCLTIIAGLAFCLVLGAGCVRRLPEQDQPDATAPGFLWPSRALLGIGMLCFMAFMIEGAMADWSGLFLITIAGATPAQGAAGFAGFSVAMATGRLLGDQVVRALGGRATLRLGAGLAVLGFTLSLGAALPRAGAIGFALVGLGLSNVVPVLFSAASRARAGTPSIGVAMAATIGYIGLLAGPPLIGFVAEALGLRAALCIPLLGAAAIAAAALLPIRRTVAQSA